MKISTLYVTYCSRQKRQTAGLLPARDRYRSARIRAVARQAERDGAAFRIFSGKYGLLTAARRIPYYDHLLEPGEVAMMTRKVAPALRGYDRVVFWYDSDDYLTPYRAVMRGAARLAGVRLTMTVRRAAGSGQ